MKPRREIPKREGSAVRIRVARSEPHSANHEVHGTLDPRDLLHRRVEVEEIEPAERDPVEVAVDHAQRTTDQPVEAQQEDDARSRA